MIDEAERADTRMMGIVHGALRRDLLRTHDALTAGALSAGGAAAGARRACGVDDGVPARASHRRGRRTMAAGAPGRTRPRARCWTRWKPIISRSARPPRRWPPPGGGTRPRSADEPRADLVAALDALTSGAAPAPRPGGRGGHAGGVGIHHAGPVACGGAAVQHQAEVAGPARDGGSLAAGTGSTPRADQIVVHTVPALPRFILLHGFGACLPAPGSGALATGRPGAGGLSGPRRADGRRSGHGAAAMPDRSPRR